VSRDELVPLSGAERALLAAIRALRFGSIEAVVHEGKLVRIEKVEKIRFDLDPRAGEGEAAEAPSNGGPPHRRSFPGGPTGGRK
jgi:hypothetical protein